MKNKPINNPLKPTTNIIKKYNFTIFIVIVVGCLSFCVLVLTNILQQSSNDVDTSNVGSTTKTTMFDQTTINRLSKLNESDEAPIGQTLPSGRINPFSE